ncbi:MAG: hypothetical protein WC821_03095 [archaeon]|jgi:hypothetical protein
MQNGQKTLILVLILLLIAIFLTNVSAATYPISNHTIQIQINSEGTDKVVEKYFIFFVDEKTKIAFRNKSLELGTNLDAWKNFDASFVPTLDPNALNKKIAYVEGVDSYLQISYDLSEQLMAKGKEATMMTEYNLKVNFFNSFYTAGQWTIPENTTVSVELPPGAEIRETVVPQATITTNGSRKIVNWQGYKRGNELTLNYILWKKITPVVDINAITSFLFKTQEGLILILISIIILIVIIMQRKKITHAIEEFVEKNSIIQEE